ncbi:major facilitator superfamily domain-containing protein [Mycena floridula]|nr:major facilitator superfamily domain-containing protein [Mycena floridula]
MSYPDDSTTDGSKKRASTATVEKEFDSQDSLGDDDPAFERKTMRSVDLHVIPILAMLYAFALIDRINLGGARTAGMGADLNLSVGNRFSIATCLYFVPYILLQIPGTLVLRKLGARNWLTICAFGWGAVQLGMAFVPTWQLLTMCRVLLGAFESALFPSIVYIISTWFTRHEVQKRLAALYLMSVTVAGFSPILAYCLSLLDGDRGIAGWSWIFLVEGVVTMVLSIVGFLYLPEFPDQNKFLSPEQTALVLRRIQEDRGDAVPDPITFEKVKTHLCDWTLWAYGIMFACASLPAYMLAYFISIILKGMGYSTANSLLLSAPPYGPAFVSAMFFAWLSDKQKHRGGYIVIQACITLIGTCLTAFAHQNSVRYFGTFLINAGSAGCVPSILAYCTNNVASQSKRSVASAVTVAFAGVSGIIASTVFREEDYPKYLPGLWVTIGSQFLLLVMVAITNIHFRRQNRLAREGKVGPLEGQPGFYYTL